MRPTRPTAGRRPPRRGAILLVVLALLALFAVLGLSFVLYAESEANAARLRRDSYNTTTATVQGGSASYFGGGPGPSVTADTAVHLFLRQVLYPVPDTGDETLSPLRGYEMARMVWGYQPGAANDTAYNGVGPFQEPITMPGGFTPASVNRTQVLNWSFLNATPSQPSPVLLDPEHSYSSGYTVRSSPATLIPTTGPTAPPFVGKNAAYTYPDLSNAYVALTDPGTGQVVVPSFHRPSLFGSLDPTNVNWTNTVGRLMMLRPRPIDQKIGSSDTPTFPYCPQNPDGSYTGDVQNLRFGNGQQRNDSVWLYPFQSQNPSQQVFTYNNKLVTMLVAPLILPLDGRVNLNTAGNLHQTATTGGSNMGFGPWEVDPTNLLGGSGNVSNLLNLRYGQSIAQPLAYGNLTLTERYFHPDPSNPFDTTGGKQFAPASNLVDWDAKFAGTGTPSGLTLPSGFASVPMWPGSPSGPYDNSNYNPGPTPPQGGEAYHHPSLYNPYQYSAASGPNSSLPCVLPVTDLAELIARYSDTPSAYGQTVIGQITNSPVGPAAGSGPNSPTNVTRALVTAISNAVRRPGFSPNYVGDGTSFQLGAGAQSPSLNSMPALNLASLPSSATGASDIVNGSPATVRNLRAGLGAVDLNRPLADYRDPTTRPAAGMPWPLSPTSVTYNSGNNSFYMAWADRQALAWDIFARLIVATGAKAVIDPSATLTNGAVKIDLPQQSGTAGSYTYSFARAAGVSYTPSPATAGLTVTQPDYDALRWLAQLAANIVDYIDNDDVSTTFVWNPIDPNNPLASSGTTSNFQSLSTINAGAVFGVEKPRLVVNETYAEVTNDPADKSGTHIGPPTDPDRATKPLRVRFWVELLNPGSTPTTVQDPLYYDTTVGGSLAGAVPLRYTAGTPTSVYKVQVYNNSGQVRTDLQATANSAGVVTSAQPKLEFSFLSATATSGSVEAIEPNNGSYAGTTAARNGFTVVGPDLQGLTAAQDNQAFIPDATSQDPLIIRQSFAAGSTNQMDYATANPPPTEDKINTQTISTLNQSRHAVLLRRLACPYLPANDPIDPTNPTSQNGAFDLAKPINPYVTVDVMAQIPVNDAVRVGSSTPPQAGTRSTGPLPSQSSNYAVGRVQPYAGYQNQTANPPLDLNPTATPSTTWKQTLTVGQNPTSATAQKQTLFRQNSQSGTTTTAPSASDATLIFPFEWLAHLDRRLVNSVELLHTTAVRPHEVTANFAGLPSSATATRPLFHQHDLQYTPTTAGNGPVFANGGGTNTSGLFRAFELLSVKPWMYGVPNGGREPGKVNINMLWDQDGTTNRSKVFDAVMGYNSGSVPLNQFTTTPGGDLDLIWNGIKTTRSPSWGTTPAVGQTVYENSTTTYNGGDRPFRSLGNPLFMAAAGTGFTAPTDPTPSSMTVGGLQDTILRSQTAGGTQSLFRRQEPNPATPLHPYVAYEPLRKAFNNFTTVSDTYLVVMTVGYFEVRNGPGPFTAANPPVLGQEVFRDVPGDLRARFAAVIDRTNFSRPVIGHVQSTSGTTLQLTGSGITASATQAAGTVYNVNWNIAPGDLIVVGEGLTAQVASVASIGTFTPPNPPSTPGSLQLTLSAAITATPGSPVAVHTNSPGTATASGVQGPRPWFTETVDSPSTYMPTPAATPAGTVPLRIVAKSASSTGVTIPYDGDTITVAVGSEIQVGTGADAEWVTVMGFDTRMDTTPPNTYTTHDMYGYDTNSGTAYLYVTPMTKNHPAGSSVAGSLLGNPGPQPNFKYTDPQYRPVVPFVTPLNR